MKAIRIHAPGGPEVLCWEDVPDPAPAPGQALIRIEAVGVNFIEVYQRNGQYSVGLPATPGNEAAGTVAAIGAGVTELAVGDRVAFQGPPSAYAELAAVPADRVVRVPASVSSKLAAAVMLQGMTAHYLTHATYALRAGDTCVVHAAAGGVGLLLTQIAKRRGARVIGTTSTAAKAALAREAGADHVVLYTDQDFAAEVKRLTGGAGAQVVYDSVGRDTFDRSLASLAPRGMMVLFGQSSGPVPPFDPQILNRAGSLFLTRPALAYYTATRAELLERAGDVLGWVADGSLAVRIHREIPLAQAAEAHRLLESRTTTGKLLLVTGV